MSDLELQEKLNNTIKINETQYNNEQNQQQDLTSQKNFQLSDKKNPLSNFVQNMTQTIRKTENNSNNVQDDSINADNNLSSRSQSISQTNSELVPKFIRLDSNISNQNSSMKDFKKKNKKEIKKLTSNKLIKVISIMSISILIIITCQILKSTLQSQECDQIKQLQNFVGQSFLQKFKINGMTSIETNVLIFLHIYSFTYNFYNPLSTLKLVCIHFGGVFIGYLLKYIYRSPRPYWIDSQIKTQICDVQFSLPCIDFLMILLPFTYVMQKIEKKNHFVYGSFVNESGIITLNRQYFKNFIKFLFYFLIFFQSFFTYVQGMNFLIDLVLGMLIYLLYDYYITFIDDSITQQINDITLLKYKAKRKIFIIFFIVILIQLCIKNYSQIIELNNVEWLQNITQCYKENQFDPQLFQSQIILQKTSASLSILYAILGSILGGMICYQNLEINWSETSNSIKFKRIILNNILIVPYWIIFYQYDKYPQYRLISFITEDEYLFKSLLFFTLVLLSFGILPAFVFTKLNWVNQDNQHYEIMDDNNQQ